MSPVSPALQADYQVSHQGSQIKVTNNVYLIPVPYWPTFPIWRRKGSMKSGIDGERDWGMEL